MTASSIVLLTSKLTHLPNFLVASKFSSVPENIKIFKRDYSNFDEQGLINDIQSIDWNFLFSCNSDPSCMFDTFYSKLSEFIDIHIPLKQLSKKESKLKTKPWITSAIRTSIKIKDKLYKKFLKTKSSYYQTKFKVYRNKLNHLIKISKRNYYNDYFSIHLNDGKRIWKGISKGYRPEARGYVIYSPRALPEGAARGQHTRGINHITTSWRPINGLF